MLPGAEARGSTYWGWDREWVPQLLFSGGASIQIPYFPSLPSLWNRTAVISNLAPIIYLLPSDLTLVQLLYLSEPQFPYLQDGAMWG